MQQQRIPATFDCLSIDRLYNVTAISAGAFLTHDFYNEVLGCAWSRNQSTDLKNLDSAVQTIILHHFF